MHGGCTVNLDTCLQLSSMDHLCSLTFDEMAEEAHQSKLKFEPYLSQQILGSHEFRDLQFWQSFPKPGAWSELFKSLNAVEREWRHLML